MLESETGNRWWRNQSKSNRTPVDRRSQKFFKTFPFAEKFSRIWQSILPPGNQKKKVFHPGPRCITEEFVHLSQKIIGKRPGLDFRSPMANEGLDSRRSVGQ